MAYQLPQECQVCGDLIQLATPRQGKLEWVCEDCWDDDPSYKDHSVTNKPGRSDRQYHGGQFNRGEW